MSAPSRDTLRRGWCPSTLRPMETGDGWLVRLHPPGSVLSPAQLSRIAALAEEHGNGLIEISARGNLQVRGVGAATHPALVEALLAERLVDEHEGDGPQRLTLISPLDLTDTAGLASAIETRARAIPSLPAKTLVIVDGGGASSLDAFACDLRLVAVAPDAIVLGLPGGAWIGPVAPGQASEIVATILQGFAARHRDAPDTIRRLRDLPDDVLARLSGLPPTHAPAPRPAPRRAGLFALADDMHAVLIGLPFGRCDAATLAAFAEAAGDAGTHAIRLSPWRGLACHGLRREAATALLARAQTLGLITGDADPRLQVQACAGKPACARGETAAMADAALLAQAAAPLLARGVTAHVSGCVKSCAHPGKADLTLVGEDGRYRVVLGGGTRDAGLDTLDLPAILPRLRPGQDIFARLDKQNRPSGPKS